jgi:hypothetical protein
VVTVKIVDNGGRPRSRPDPREPLVPDPGRRLFNFRDRLADTARLMLGGEPPPVEPGSDPDTDKATRLVLVSTAAWRLREIEAWRNGGDRVVTPDPTQPLPIGPDGWPDSGHARLLRALLPTRDGTGRAWICEDPPGQDRAPVHLPWHAGGVALARQLAGKVHQECQRVAVQRAGEAPNGVGPHEKDDADRTLDRLRHRVLLDAARVGQILRAGWLSTASPSDAPELETDDRAVAAAATAAIEQARAEGLDGWYVAVDLRFQYLLERPLCLASITIWSGVPWGLHFAPAELPRPELPERQLDLGQSQRLFTAVQEGLSLLFARYFNPAVFRVYRNAYQMPLFWVAVPLTPSALPGGYLEPAPRALVRTLASRLLSAQPGDSVVARSVVGGEHLVLRRVRENTEHSRAHYLIVPGRPVARVSPDEDAPDVPEPPGGARAVAQQELATAQVVEALSALEARSGAELYGVQSDLENLGGHLRIYREVAERGAFLWDGLSTHLPVRRWNQLNQAHRAVELLHQILLQSVADLGHLGAQTGDCRERIDWVAEALTDAFDQRLTETPWPGGYGLRDAMVRVGLFERVEQGAERLEEDTERVKARYGELQNAITGAFDERRVRDVDTRQNGNFTIAFALIAAAVVTVAQTTFRLVPSTGPLTVFGDQLGSWNHWNQVIVGSIWAAAIAMVAVGGYVAWRLWRSTKLGSHRFRRLYNGPRLPVRLLLTPLHRVLHHRGRWPGPLARAGDRLAVRVEAALSQGLWHFLKDASTDGLDSQVRAARRLREQECARLTRAAGDDPERQRAVPALAAARLAAFWKEQDDALARRFVQLWDAAAVMDDLDRDDRFSRDIRALSGRIEQWGVHALLLTELARRLHRYPLPKLACLYRGANRLADEARGFLAIVDPDRRLTIMPEKDFVRSLQQFGFVQRRQALELDKLVLQPVSRSAADLLARLDRIGLHARIGPGGHNAVLARARDLRLGEPPVPCVVPPPPPRRERQPVSGDRL